MRVIAALCCVVFAFGCGPGSRNGGSCSAGETHCDGKEYQTCVGGKFENQMSCPMACSEGLGCTVCTPGTGTCSGNVSHACNDDGMGYTDITCDPAQGETCDAAAGVCAGDCWGKALGNSCVGCEYYPTVTGNTVGDTFDFAVAMANTTSSPVAVTIDGGALTTPLMVTIPASSVLVQTLPWVNTLKLCDSPTTDGCQSTGPHYAAQTAKGAYHL